VFLDRKIRTFNRYLYWSGGGFVLLLMLVTSADVVGRYLLNKPLHGALEMTELGLIAMVTLTWAYTQAEKGHISLDLLFSHFSHRVQSIIGMFTSFLGMFVVGLIAWYAVPFALDSRASMEWTARLHIPLYPFKFLIFIGGLALFFQFALDMLDSYRQLRGYRHGNNT